jgi:hypothetical protein
MRQKFPMQSNGAYSRRIRYDSEMDIGGSRSDQPASVVPQWRSDHVCWVRVLALTLAFFLVCTIIGAIVIGVRVAGGFNDIRNNWTTFRANVDPRVVYIGNVRDTFGTPAAKLRRDAISHSAI